MIDIDKFKKEKKELEERIKRQLEETSIFINCLEIAKVMESSIITIEFLMKMLPSTVKRLLLNDAISMLINIIDSIDKKDKEEKEKI